MRYCLQAQGNSHHTLQLGLWWAANAILPENGCVIHKGELELRLQVKVLPASNSHRGVEDVGHKERNTHSDVGLDQVQDLSGRHILQTFVMCNCVSAFTKILIRK